jgi:hypothetical protein
MLEKHICDYGCGKQAVYQFKNGKFCCSKSKNSCTKQKQINRESTLGKKMTHVEKFLKKFGIKSEFESLVERAYYDKKINDEDRMIALKKYDEEYRNSILLDKNIITIQELRRRKEKKDRDRIIQRLLENAGKVQW